jgi:glucose-specific phosphotransferase system IIA component
MAIFRRLVDQDRLPTHTRQIPILSPLSGRVFGLDHATNPIFTNRLMGEGVSISPTGYQVFCPFDGKVISLSVCMDQIKIKSKQGIVVYIQMGIDNPIQYGEGLKAKVKLGHIVKQGDTLLEFDLAKIKAKTPNFACACTILNSDKTKGVLIHSHTVRAGEDPMMTLLI